MDKSGQAFPGTELGPAGAIPVPGLTKREYFAAMAMQGMLANGDYGASGVADNAVDYADALLAALNGGGDGS